MAIKHVAIADKRKQSSVLSQKKDKSSRKKVPKEYVECVANKDGKSGIFYFASIFSLAFGFGCLHIYHVSSMFENDRHFSHLSMMEREMTFRTEMGLYYSYYKRIVEAPSFQEGFSQITNDNLTEYPKVINTLQRFNLYPEVVIGFLYRTYLYAMDFVSWPTKQCWQIERGQNLAPVTSCEGLGDPMYFYLEMVWLFAGLTVALLFIYGIVLSNSIVGGFLTVVCFFYNHSEATRVQWTPPLRESFAYPFILLQLLCVTYYLRSTKDKRSAKLKIPFILQLLAIYASTWICLILWQFSQFLMATQVIAVYLMFVTQMIKKDVLLVILIGQILGVIQACLSLFGNKLLVCSLLTCMLICVIIILLTVEPMLKQCNFVARSLALSALAGAGTLVMKGWLNAVFNNKDDDHIMNIMLSKVTNFKDFHSLLYTCSMEFDFMQPDVVKKLCATLLLPSVVLALVVLANHWTKCFILDRKRILENPQKKSERERSMFHFVAPDVFYNVIQLLAFAVMAGFIMRLKLFFTPQLCILTSLLATRKYFGMIKSVEMHWALLASLVACMSIFGISNINTQRNILGEYSNVPMEELLIWVKTETKPNAVFAGPMPVMASILLSTRRPIVNHPHYEDAELRARTRAVYSMFSRKSAQDVFNILLNMKVEYLVIDESWCFRESKKGCSMVDLWDVEEPFNKHKPPLCPLLFIKSPSPFHRVFANEAFVVLRLHSQYVEIKPIKEYKI